MTQIFKIVSEWNGFQGGPGYTNLFFRNIFPDGTPTNLDDRASAEVAAERVRAFWQTCAPYLPDDVTIQIQSNVDMLEDTTGALTGGLTIDARQPVRGIPSDSYSAASGAVVSWQTSTIRNRRRIRGRTFLVPLAAVGYTTTGQIFNNARNDIQGAADDLADPLLASTFGVYARPSAKGASDGQWAEVTSGRVSGQVAILRSRRD